jgi:chaperonin GroEL (HSP60 family)
MSLVQKLRRLSSRYEGRQQLAIDGFADALEAIPATLAKNAGMDVIATVAALRASHAAGDARVGIDSRRRKLADMGRLGVLDPFSVKRKILLTAFGVGAMLIRIDSMILQHQLSGEERILKEREKHTDPERIEKRRRDYGGMEKLDWPRWRPSRETRIVNR